MDGIIKRLQPTVNSDASIREAVRSQDRLVISVINPAMTPAQHARIIINKIRRMPYKDAPKRVHFGLSGEPYGTFCDAIEALVICDWD